MELAFQTNPLHFLRRSAQEIRYQEETAETIVPDSYPDIASIADCHACAILRGKDCRDGSVVISGAIKAEVLYNPEDGSYPRHLEFYIPYTVKFENAALTERAQVQCTTRIRSVDARMINSRKAMLRANLGCEITAYDEAEEPLYTLQTDCKALETKISTFQISLPLETAEKSFVISDTLELPAGRPPIAQVYKAHCQAELTDQKLVGSRGVFKGILTCKLLYLSDNQTLYLWQQQLPFSQYCELQKDYDEESLTVIPAITGYDLDLEGAEDARHILLTVNLLAQCLVTGTQPLQLMEDAYCTRGSLQPVWKEYQLDTCLDRQSSLQTVRQSLSGPLQEILDTDVYPDYPAQERQGEQIRVTVPVSMRVLGYDENGSLCARSGKGEAAQELALSDQALCRVRAALSGEPLASPSAGGVEVRCGVSVETACYGRQELRALCGGTVDEAEDRKARPSVIMRAAQKNEALWSIAKACRSTTDAIRAANHLETDRLTDDAMLLIPVG